MDALRTARGIIFGVIAGFCLWAAILTVAFGVAAARADTFVHPTKDRDSDVAEAAATASASATSNPSASAVSDLASAVTIEDSPVRVLVGGAGGSDLNHWTADCVAPAEGGMLKRGVNFLGLFRVSQKAVVDEACVAEKQLEAERAHEIRLSELANERLLLEIRLQELAQK